MSLRHPVPYFARNLFKPKRLNPYSSGFHDRWNLVFVKSSLQFLITGQLDFSCNCHITDKIKFARKFQHSGKRPCWKGFFCRYICSIAHKKSVSRSHKKKRAFRIKKKTYQRKAIKWNQRGSIEMRVESLQNSNNSKKAWWNFALFFGVVDGFPELVHRTQACQVRRSVVERTLK